MYSYEFDCYERAVRERFEGQDCSIINCYVHLGIAKAGQYQTAAATKRVYMRMLFVLEETIYDSIIPYQWRKHCYRVLKQLMPVIYEVQHPNEYNRICIRLNTLSAFFLSARKDNQYKSKLTRNNKSADFD